MQFCELPLGAEPLRPESGQAVGLPTPDRFVVIDRATVRKFSPMGSAFSAGVPN